MEATQLSGCYIMWKELNMENNLIFIFTGKCTFQSMVMPAEKILLARTPLVVTFQRILKLVSFLNAKRPEGFRGDRSKLLWRTREDATVHMKPLHVANNRNSNSWNTFCRLVTRWIHKVTPKGFKKCPICCAMPGVYENSGVKKYLSQWGVICILYWPVTHWQLFYRFLFNRTRTRTIRQVAGRSPPWSQSQTHFTTALEPSLSHLG